MIVFSGLVLYYVFEHEHLFVLSSCLLFAFLQCMNNRPAHLARLLYRYRLRVVGCVLKLYRSDIHRFIVRKAMT